MTPPVLYGHHLSGHSYKAALLLALGEIPYEFRHVDISKPRPARSAEFQKVSHFGEVPVLLDGARVICQSDAVLKYLADLLPPSSWNDPERQWRVLEWLFWEANRIGFSVSNLRFTRRFKKDPNSEEIAFLRARAIDDLDRLDEEFAETPFLTGPIASIADIACCAYLYWLDEAGLRISDWPGVEKWLGRIAQLPGWFHPDDMPRQSRVFAPGVAAG